jgi:RNA 2',3'-cyclic 3'-phosphodiesterase
MKRIFVALKVQPGETLIRMISSLKLVLNRENIKWTNPENIHITLAFIGDTEEDQIRIIRKTLLEKCEGFGKFELMIKGSGVFKSISDPRVIWAGIEPSEKFNNLNGLIKIGLKTAGIILEERPFKPHLTLGRIKHPNQLNNLSDAIEKFSNIEIQKINVNEVILFESILFQAGAVYRQIDKFII